VAGEPRIAEGGAGGPARCLQRSQAVRRHQRDRAEFSRAPADVGRNDYNPLAPHLLSHDEIAELAEACVAMLETNGQSIELTLSEMSVEGGGFLLLGDAPRVREKANALLSTGGRREGEVRGEFSSCQLALAFKD
jgi:hypothetical protein